ncbi:hypothetical protein [Paenibacillus thiaminolyticus]|uniref:Uncharacterized protein n=1 Tax=Paenibacillus thiaminolyticus TaxID=49283 RepID=A0A3A3GCM5_PANTH|nr:hypothetical protein [Paenibacillus thiaminolyticus]RJG21462.1 hypothetical protein DQX05_21575 [Paenibacillus thiaminolyticus]
MRKIGWSQWGIAAITAALLLGAVPAHAQIMSDVYGESEADTYDGSRSDETRLEKVEASVLEQVRSGMERLAGKEIELDSAADASGTLTIYGKDNRNYARIFPDGLMTIEVTIPYADLGERERTAADKAIKGLDGKNKFTITRAVRTMDSNSSTIRSELYGKGVWVSLKNGIVENVSLDYPLTKTDKKMSTRAQQAVARMSAAAGVKAPKLTTATRYKSQDENVWILQDPNMNVLVTVGAKTGNIWGVAFNEYANDGEAADKAAAKLTKETAVALAAPVVKQIFGLDLTGYGMKRDKDDPSIILFTKRGQPTVEGFLNGKGKFNTFKVTPAIGAKE